MSKDKECALILVDNLFITTKQRNLLRRAIEPQKGKWIDGFCNICDCACKSDGWGREIETNFCPNCGADMREADNDN